MEQNKSKGLSTKFLEWLFIDAEDIEQSKQREENNKKIKYKRVEISHSYAPVVIAEEMRLANDITLYKLGLTRENFDKNGKYRRN